MKIHQTASWLFTELNISPNRLHVAYSAANLNQAAGYKTKNSCFMISQYHQGQSVSNSNFVLGLNNPQEMSHVFDYITARKNRKYFLRCTAYCVLLFRQSTVYQYNECALLFRHSTVYQYNECALIEVCRVRVNTFLKRFRWIFNWLCITAVILNYLDCIWTKVSNMQRRGQFSVSLICP
jgi:hypothetical protein